MLISIAIDFRHADAATRERFHLSEERLTQLYRTARTEVITESALISTCNRTELYAWVDSDDPQVIERSVQVLARRWMRTRSEGDVLLTTATRRLGRDAAEHVVRIASGLESQVLGDGQILGQLKAAYKRASRGQAADPVLHRLFETALRAGKRVQTETSLTAGRNSVGAEAAITASQRFGNLENARCVIIGAGKTGARAAKQLHKLGARDIVVVNRTYENAASPAGMVGGRAAGWEAIHVEAAMADVVIVATGSEVPVVEAASLHRAREACAATGYALLMMASACRATSIRLSPMSRASRSSTSTPCTSRCCRPRSCARMRCRTPKPFALTKPTRSWSGWPRCRRVMPSSRCAKRSKMSRVVRWPFTPRTSTWQRRPRRALQRGEPLDQHAMMLLEMFAPAGGAGASAADMRRSGTHRAVAPTPSPAAPEPVARVRQRVTKAAASATASHAPSASVPDVVPLVASQQFN